MKIVVGLGNPGREYAQTRHNVGFMVVEKFAAERSLLFSRRKFRSQIACGSVAGKEILLVKPQTFMNLSGDSVGPLVRFYKLSLADLLVVYDDVDIPFGNIRLRPFGGSGGHKGLKSIIASLGDDAFPRLRVGISGAASVDDLSEYVLSRFAAEERLELEGIIQRACDAVEAVLTGPLDKAMNQFN